MTAAKKTSSTASARSKPTGGKSHGASTHPTWVDMIKECITAHPDDARSGVSRATIKKFVENKYKIEVNASATSQLNRAITSGSEKGVFVLPKGPSGKVKLAPKTRHDAAKENATPVMKKPATKAKATAVATKKVSAKPATQKSSSKPAKTVSKGSASPAKVSVAPKVTKKYSSAKKASSTKKIASAKKGTTARKPSTAKKASSAKKAPSARAPAKPKVSKTKAGSKTGAAPKAKPKTVSKVKPASKSAKPRSSTKKVPAATV